jgi:hypothetical protein
VIKLIAKFGRIPANRKEKVSSYPPYGRCDESEGGRERRRLLQGGTSGATANTAPAGASAKPTSKHRLSQPQDAHYQCGSVDITFRAHSVCLPRNNRGSVMYSELQTLEMRVMDINMSLSESGIAWKCTQSSSEGYHQKKLHIPLPGTDLVTQDRG